MSPGYSFTLTFEDILTSKLLRRFSGESSKSYALSFAYASLRTSPNMEKESYKVRFRKMIHKFREDDNHISNSKNILYNNNNNTTNTFSLRNSCVVSPENHRSPTLVPRYGLLPNANTQTKKRNYSESFGYRDYEVERYGQDITAEFFQNNIGHGVIG
jgi:hypothetical protein